MHYAHGNRFTAFQKAEFSPTEKTTIKAPSAPRSVSLCSGLNGLRGSTGNAPNSRCGLIMLPVKA